MFHRNKFPFWIVFFHETDCLSIYSHSPLEYIKQKPASVSTGCLRFVIITKLRKWYDTWVETNFRNKEKAVRTWSPATMANDEDDDDESNPDQKTRLLKVDNSGVIVNGIVNCTMSHSCDSVRHQKISIRQVFELSNCFGWDASHRKLSRLDNGVQASMGRVFCSTNIVILARRDSHIEAGRIIRMILLHDSLVL